MSRPRSSRVEGVGLRVGRGFDLLDTPVCVGGHLRGLLETDRWK